MSTLADQISDGIKDAMRAKDRARLAALRDIKSKILLEATKDGAGDQVDDATTMTILSKLVKQRNETATLYRDQGRPDLAEEEEAQAQVIQEFLPAALTEDEIEAKVKEIIASTEASSMADMGKVMGLASAAMAGQADGKVISGFVRKILSS
ncbi:MAG: GatB/YqeY domain-containing protein [Flavobacteriales bacterium]